MEKLDDNLKRCNIAHPCPCKMKSMSIFHYLIPSMEKHLIFLKIWEFEDKLRSFNEFYKFST